ncbi:MAG: L-histidine N(alpha)-methyltransferase [Gammaproteobacteria bacterium]|nr:L-histidine N(alpha)-methyltransferase [Gammaproteobacteria bacterium]
MNGVNIGPIQFYDHHPAPADFYSDVIKGLQQDQKMIPPKYFYDQKGSELFDLICDTQEYYPTRTELAILKDNANEIADNIGPECLLVEPGSGSSYKVRSLLDALKPQAYVPMDISKTYLIEAASKLSDDYPWLEVHASCIDFTDKLHLPPILSEEAKKVAFFPGSSIGNFEPADAVHFMSDIANMVGEEGGLLIGVDLKKDKTILDSAYNDNQDITAQFNMNLLTRINNELNAEFDLASFEHNAFYNEKLGRIEMHLVSNMEQEVSVDDVLIKFDKGESIHTESSYKYSIAEFQKLAGKAGFESSEVWTDKKDLFSLHYFTMT